MYRRPGRLVWYAFLDSRRRHISLGTEDETKAAKEFARLLERRRPEKIAPSGYALGEIFKLCYDRAKVNHTPKTAYQLNVKLVDVLGWLEQRRIVSPAEISIALVEEYKAERRQKWSARSLNRYLDAWKKAQKHAVELGSARPDSLLSFQKLREPRPVPHQRGLTKSELDRFLRAVRDKRYRTLFRMVLGCGIRDDEMRHLRLADLGSDTITITPQEGWTTKNYRYRTIPVSASTLKAAREFLKIKPGLNLDNKKIWKVINRTCEATGIAHFSMHDLRRAWASHMLAAGNKVERISQWLGHADVLTTMRYLRVVQTEMPDRKRLPW
jgi:integrase